MIFKPAYPYVDDAVVHGVMSKFNPGEKILKAGTQLHPACSPLKHDLRMLQDVPVKMRDGVTIYTDICPYYSFSQIDKLSAGQVVDLDIILSPIGMVFYPGETMRVVVSTKDEIGSIMPGTPGCIPDNKGTHILHVGGKYPSYIQLPVMPD